MDTLTVACIQPRISIEATHEEFESLVRRYMRQTKSAHLVVLPELVGVMLAPPLISSFKLGFIKQADRGRHPRAGFIRRQVGQVAGVTADALGGGFSGSLGRLLAKNSDALSTAYLEAFQNLAREYGTLVVAGSLYLKDEESEENQNRAYLFSPEGDTLGYQAKLNLSPAEARWVAPGHNLTVFDTKIGRLGILIGRDALYPELARCLAAHGAEILVGVFASPGEAQANVLRSAMALRAEENQVFTVASFLLGPNYLDNQNKDDYFGQSAVLAPVSLTDRGDGLLAQAGSSRTESVITATLGAEAMQAIRDSGRFRPRQEMHLGSAGPSLAEFYSQGLTIEQSVEGLTVTQVDQALEPVSIVLEPELEPESVLPLVEDEAPPPSSIPEALSLTATRELSEDEPV